MLKGIDELSSNEYKDFYEHPDDWAIRNFKKGDSIIALISYDEDSMCDTLVHSFLMRRPNGDMNTKFYDVRGEADTFEEITDCIDKNIKTFQFSFNNIGDFERFLNELYETGSIDPDNY